MFQHGAPEKLIQERTGHRSVEGLRAYERLNESQHKAVSALLARKPDGVQYSKRMQMQSLNMPSTSSTGPVAQPAFNVHEMHGCTINNFYGVPPPQPPQPHSFTFTEEEINQLASMQEL